MKSLLVDVMEFAVKLVAIGGVVRLLVVCLSIGILYAMAFYRSRLIPIVAPIAAVIVFGAIYAKSGFGLWTYYTLSTVLLAPLAASIYLHWRRPKDHSTIR